MEVFHHLTFFDPPKGSFLFLATSCSGHPPHPPEAQVSQDELLFFLPSKGSSTKMKAARTISEARMVCIILQMYFIFSETEITRNNEFSTINTY